MCPLQITFVVRYITKTISANRIFVDIFEATVTDCLNWLKI